MENYDTHEARFYREKLYREIKTMWEQHRDGLEFWPTKHNKYMQSLEKKGWIVEELFLFCDPGVFEKKFKVNIKELTIKKYWELQKKHPQEDMGEYCAFLWVLRPLHFYTFQELKQWEQEIKELNNV